MITALDAQAWAAKNIAKLIIAGALVLGFAGSNVASYFYGKSVQRTSYAAQENKLLQKDLELKQRENDLNAKEAEDVAARAAASDARVNKGLGELRDAIQKAGVNPSCDLSPSELQSLQDIAEG